MFGWLKKKENVVKLTLNQKHLLVIMGLSFENQVKLQKTVFLLQKDHKAFKYQWIRADYGPFSRELDSDIKELESMTLIEITHNLKGERKFNITQKGIGVVEFPKINFINSALKYRGMDKDSVLREVYERAKVCNYEIGDVIKAEE